MWKKMKAFHLVAVTALLLAAVVGPDGIARVAPAGIHHGDSVSDSDGEQSN